MKKLSILCGITLMLALASGPAYAASFSFDLDGNGVPGDTELTIYQSDTVEVGIYITGWDLTTNCFGADWYFRWHTESLEYVSHSWDTTVWDDATVYVNSEIFSTQFKESPCVPGPTIKLLTVVLHCLTAPSTDFIKATLSPDGVAADCDGGTVQLSDGDANIIQLPKICSCSSVTCTSGCAEPGNRVDAGATAQLAVGEFFCNPPATDPTWSVLGAGGSVDGSGLFTADMVDADTIVTVCVTDGNGNWPAACCKEITAVPKAGCQMKIYRGGKICCEDAIDDPVYNRPGRRGLAMTCCEVVDFCICTDCEPDPHPPAECYEWDIVVTDGWTGFDPDADIDLQVIPTETCFFVRLDVINCPKKFVELEVTATDTCNGLLTDTVHIYLGKVAVGIGDTNAHPNSETADIDLLLSNPENHVKAVQVDLCSDALDRCQEHATALECEDQTCTAIIEQVGCEDAGCTWSDTLGCYGMEDNCVWLDPPGTCVANDNMVCTECVVDEDRTPEFVCSANEITELGDTYGCCRVVVYTTEPDDLIQQGEGAIARVKYDVLDSKTSKECVPLWPFDIKVSDQFNEYLCACPEAGEICFRICGDVYPQDCYECTSCGDGVVDIFDILEEIDIILGLQNASACQAMCYHGDVPVGMPPYCGPVGGETPAICDPPAACDGEIDIFDALVIIDKALSKMNCCDYCMFGLIYQQLQRLVTYLVAGVLPATRLHLNSAQHWLFVLRV